MPGERAVGLRHDRLMDRMTLTGFAITVVLTLIAGLVIALEVTGPASRTTAAASSLLDTSHYVWVNPADSADGDSIADSTRLPFNLPTPKPPTSRAVRVVHRPTSGDAGTYGPPGETGELGIPVLVLEAYQNAERVLGSTEPGCHLGWWILAGIGHTESDHAESGRVLPDGTTRGRILGPRLDGHLADNSVIRDTDHGALDGDTKFDRAVGPMQFIPGTWRHWGIDANGDGKADPNNVFDASLAAAYYLCNAGRDLRHPSQLKAAILSYNHSEPYYNTVIEWASAYHKRAIAIANSTLTIASPDAPKPASKTTRPAARTTKPRTTTTSSPARGSAPSPSSSPSSGSTSGSTSGSPTTSSSPTSTSTSSAAPNPLGSLLGGLG